MCLSKQLFPTFTRAIVSSIDNERLDIICLTFLKLASFLTYNLIHLIHNNFIRPHHVAHSSLFVEAAITCIQTLHNLPEWTSESDSASKTPKGFPDQLTVRSIFHFCYRYTFFPVFLLEICTWLTVLSREALGREETLSFTHISSSSPKRSKQPLKYRCPSGIMKSSV